MPDGSPDDRFVEALQQIGAVTSAQLEAARAEQAKRSNHGSAVPLPDVLVEMGVTTSVMRENIEKKLREQNDGGLKKLGPYKLVKKLGAGGMGTVFLAEDTQMGRLCALKVLTREYSDNDHLLTRFHREAMATGKLNHPNIVVAYTVGEEQGVHYYAMEYCTGLPLDRAIGRAGAVPWQVALDVVTQVARGLQHAHAYDIVHRDIKPANIFICRPAGSPSATATGDAFQKGFVAKILDLGLSKTISSNAESSYLTQTGMTLGTPHYMAPEQARGEKEIDGRADIYSLGATFFELVTGETPFSGTTPAAVIIKHLSEPLRNPKELRPDIPDGVVQVIQRMMAKEPTERYANCAELLTDIEKLATSQAPANWIGAVVRRAPAAPLASITVASAKAPTVASAPAVPANVPGAPTAFATNVDAATAAAAQTLGIDRQRLIAVAAAVVLGIVFLIWVFGSRGSTNTAEVRKAAELSLQQERERAQASVAEAERAKREAESRATQAEKVAAEERTARLNQLEQQLQTERRQTEETKRQLEEAKRQAEEAKRPAEQKSPTPVVTMQSSGKEEPLEIAGPTAPVEPAKKGPLEPNKRSDDVLAALERWADAVFQAPRAAEPLALADLSQEDNVEGLKRLHMLLARRALEAQDAARRAQDNEAALKNRTNQMQRRPVPPERQQPPKPIFPPPNRPVYQPPDDRAVKNRDVDTQQLDAQIAEIHDQGERMANHYKVISAVKQKVADRLRALGVQDLTTAPATPKRDVPYKVYVLKNGTELKAYMAVKMGEQVTIKDEQGEMQTIQSADVKEVRDGP